MTTAKVTSDRMKQEIVKVMDFFTLHILDLEKRKEAKAAYCFKTNWKREDKFYCTEKFVVVRRFSNKKMPGWVRVEHDEGTGVLSISIQSCSDIRITAYPPYMIYAIKDATAGRPTLELEDCVRRAASLKEEAVVKKPVKKEPDTTPKPAGYGAFA